MSFGYTAGVVLLTAIAITFVPKLMTPTLPVEVKVQTAPGWEKLGDTFRSMIEENPSRGYAFAVYHRGELVADLYGGYADAAAWAPWKEDTLSIIFSATKGISAICIALLVDRGLLDYKKPIADYWPEFDDSGNGREKITLEMLMSHQAGLVTFDEEWSVFDILNEPEKITNMLLKTKPDWEPGTKHGYHMLTQGMLINEIIMRIDPQHRTLDQFFMEEIAEPLELDAMIGLPHEENYRATRLITWTSGIEDWQGLIFGSGWKLFTQMLNPNSFMKRGFYKEVDMDGILNNPEFRRVPLGASHAFGTARDFAKLYGILTNGGNYNNRLFLSEEVIKSLTEVLVSGTDYVMGVPLSLGRGMSMLPTPAGSVKFGFPGAGGMMAHGDLKNKLGFSFVTTKMYSGLNTSPQFDALENVMYECLQNIQKST